MCKTYKDAVQEARQVLHPEEKVISNAALERMAKHAGVKGLSYEAALDKALKRCYDFHVSAADKYHNAIEERRKKNNG